MKTNLYKLGTLSLRAAIAAAALPVLLFFSAGTSQADREDGELEVSFTPLPGSLIVHITSWTVDDANCVYQADWYQRAFNLTALASIHRLTWRYGGVGMKKVPSELG